ncbi:DUF262 domain-containing protein [Ectothiorhodospiraceae bacterium BW-2]|nr:DUF262 domain-containing protein [Ectothiorhodospiraceae bacterium BW-2]
MDNNLTPEIDQSQEEEPLEAEQGLTASNEGIYPNAVIKINRDQYSAFEIKRMVETTHELRLDPEFQRHNVWVPSQKRELIESLLMGIPIPVIYVFENEQGIKQMVDGRQRISAIIEYMNGGFTLDNLNMLPDFNGKKFDQLDPLYRSKLERYQLLVYVIEPPTPERVKYDIFDRVNRGGTQLNNQEMRNALYYGQATQLLNELASLEVFHKATGGAIKPKRMRDQYIILRFIAFYLLRQGKMVVEYRSNMDEFLATTMKWLNQADVSELEHIKQVFSHAMQSAWHYLGEDGFRFDMTNINRRPINMALFEVLAYFFAITPLDAVEPETIVVAINQLKQRFDHSNEFSGRVDTSNGVAYRFNQVEQLKEQLTC